MTFAPYPQNPFAPVFLKDYNAGLQTVMQHQLSKGINRRRK
jgi:hypothetical protein